MGTDVTIHMYTDSSVATGIATRNRLGKVRHIEVNQLWLQGKISEGTITVDKVARILNQADIFTHHVTAQCTGRTYKRDWHMASAGTDTT